MKKFLSIALVPLLLAGCGSSDDSNSYKSSSSDSSDDKIQGWGAAKARSYCHDQVEKQLVSPSTAGFEGMTEYTASQSSDGSAWEVQGHVDSENGFGAKIRSTYTCTLTPSDEDNATVSVDIQ